MTRRKLAVALVVPLLLSVAACGSGSKSASSQTAASTTTSASPSTSTSAPPSPTTSATPTTTPTPLKTTSTAHVDPGADKDADFGFVKTAKAVSGGVEITFDRAVWLTAKQVPAWNKAHPGTKVIAEDDYAIVNESTKVRSFLVKDGAALFGSILLGGDTAPKKITAAQLVSGIKAAGSIGVTCWIYHKYGGLTGDVVQLEEQYRP